MKRSLHFYKWFVAVVVLICSITTMSAQTKVTSLSQLKAGSVIWKKSEVGYKDDVKTIVDETTADYTVKGIADEGMSEDLFLLQRNVK